MGKDEIKTDCVLGATNKTRIHSLEGETEKQWEAINQLQKRLPIWATVVMTLMGTMLGSALTYAALAVKLAMK